MPLNVVSADNHILEPPDVYLARAPAALRDRAPRIMAAPGGGEGWSFDGNAPLRSFGIEAMGGRAYEDFQADGLSFSDIPPGNYDGAAHLADMELDGVDAAVVYPGNAHFLFQIDDRELAVACIRAYNDWIVDDFSSANRSRLVGLPMLPLEDGMDVTLAEFDRLMAKDVKAMWIPGSPSKPWIDDYYEPLWERAGSAGIPLTFHRNHGGPPRDADWDSLMDGNFSVAGIVNRFFSAVRPFTYLAMAGTFDRHPGLKIVAAEVNWGWVPFWAQMMNQAYEKERHWAGLELSREPSGYLGENLFMTGLDDYFGFANLDDPHIARAAMYSTDYPHSVTLWPKSREYIAKLTEGLDDTTTHEVLAGNAARVYGLT